MISNEHAWIITRIRMDYNAHDVHASPTHDPHVRRMTGARGATSGFFVRIAYGCIDPHFIQIQFLGSDLDYVRVTQSVIYVTLIWFNVRYWLVYFVYYI